MIQLRNITKSFGDKIVLKDIDLDIANNEFVCIVGNSGEGKSTLLNLLGLFDMPTSGNYFLDGKDILNKSVNKPMIRLNQFGFVFQSFYLIEELSVIENIKVPLIYARQRLNVKERIRKYLADFNLTELENKKCKYLSGGEKQRVAFIRAIINDPNYIFCDEPTGNLDGKNSKEIIDFLKAMNLKGKTIVLISHDINIVNGLKSEGATAYELSGGQLHQI